MASRLLKIPVRVRIGLWFALLVILASCSSTSQRQEKTESRQAAHEQPRYQAWRGDDSQMPVAIRRLVLEADRLIRDRQFDAASDKLERVLRIQADYAPAWSRLSWLALQDNAPDQAIQLARRSNMLAADKPSLLLLNWDFIRLASIQLQDDGLHRQAVDKIQSLKAL